MISNAFGIDDKSPIYPSIESARAVAGSMLRIYHGKVRVEIYQVIDVTTHQRKLIESIGSPD
jgi:hypothetical protein